MNDINEMRCLPEHQMHYNYVELWCEAKPTNVSTLQIITWYKDNRARLQFQ